MFLFLFFGGIFSKMFILLQFQFVWARDTETDFVIYRSAFLCLLPNFHFHISQNDTHQDCFWLDKIKSVSENE